MGFKTNSDDDEAVSEINVTPLVDVMLVLVIILMVTAPLLTQTVNVTLPKTATTSPDDQKLPLQIAIDAKGNILLNKFPITDDSALEAALKIESAKNSDLGIHMYADKDVSFGRVAEVMATVQHAGIYKLSFVTQEKH
jgi:biopolymer transport protein TolR